MKGKLTLLTVLTFAATMGYAKPLIVTSPDSNVKLTFDIKDGKPEYSVARSGQQILRPSRLGLKLKDLPDFTEGVSLKSSSRESHSESWQPVWGEESEIANNYNELRVKLVQKKMAPGRSIDIVFSVFDDGIGFRYEFPRQKDLQDFAIMDEVTEFSFCECPTTWSIPAEGYRFYEALFREMPLDQMGKVSTPVTVILKDGTHIALHEANLTDYAAMNLQATPGSNTLKAELSPWQSGEKVFVTDTRVSPWRTMIIADNAGDMALAELCSI